MRKLLLAAALFLALPVLAGEADVVDVKVPAGVTRVTVRARHKPKGYDGKTMSVTLPR